MQPFADNFLADRRWLHHCGEAEKAEHMKEDWPVYSEFRAEYTSTFEMEDLVTYLVRVLDRRD